MSQAVHLTDAAARDLDELYAGAYERGGDLRATAFLDRIEDLLGKLANGELRSSTPPLLEALGKVAVRQHVADGLRVLFRPYEQRIAVVLIAPVQRSFQSLLERRVLDG